MNLKTGLQLYTVKKALTNDYFGTLEKVAEIGYENVELYFHSPYLARFDVPCPAKELKAKIQELSLNVISSHVIFHQFLDWDEVIKYNAEIGSGGIVIPMYLYNLNSSRTKPQEAVEFSKWLNQMGQKCKDNGMKLYYHNHWNEFEVFDGKYIFDLLLENTDPELVKFEIDVYWTVRGGIDPVQWMDKVGKRCELIQACDLRAEAENKNLNAVDGAFNNAFFPKMHTHYGDYTEIGNGIMDFPAIIQKTKEIGSIEYVIVSQVEPGEKTEFQVAKENLEALNKIIG